MRGQVSDCEVGRLFGWSLRLSPARHCGWVGGLGRKIVVDECAEMTQSRDVRAGLRSWLKQSTFEPNTLGVRSVVVERLPQNFIGFSGRADSFCPLFFEWRGRNGFDLIPKTLTAYRGCRVGHVKLSRQKQTDEQMLAA